MSAIAPDPEITKAFLVQIMRDAFPGVKLAAVDRIGGVVVSAHIWQFIFEASLNTSAVGLNDDIGFATLQLVQTLKSPGQDKNVGQPVKIFHTRTRSPDAVKAFLARSKAFLQGAAAVILSACDKPERGEADIFGDGWEDPL